MVATKAGVKRMASWKLISLVVVLVVLLGAILWYFQDTVRFSPPSSVYDFQSSYYSFMGQYDSLQAQYTEKQSSYTSCSNQLSALIGDTDAQGDPAHESEIQAQQEACTLLYDDIVASIGGGNIAGTSPCTIIADRLETLAGGLLSFLTQPNSGSDDGSASQEDLVGLQLYGIMSLSVSEVDNFCQSLNALSPPPAYTPSITLPPAPDSDADASTPPADDSTTPVPDTETTPTPPADDSTTPAPDDRTTPIPDAGDDASPSSSSSSSSGGGGGSSSSNPSDSSLADADPDPDSVVTPAPLDSEAPTSGEEGDASSDDVGDDSASDSTGSSGSDSLDADTSSGTTPADSASDSVLDTISDIITGVIDSISGFFDTLFS